MKVVTCNGCFDRLHAGHLLFLGYCRAQGDYLVVGLNSDEYLAGHKRTVFVPFSKRRLDLLETGVVDEVIEFKEETPVEFIKSVMPSVHCIGEEYAGRNVEEGVCKELGISVVYVPRFGRWSSANVYEGGKRWL
ncbi:MAG: adenylyltransferase/cytidyltransferase family protein [Candidatus Methanomethylicaceae archaeon]